MLRAQKTWKCPECGAVARVHTTQDEFDDLTRFGIGQVPVYAAVVECDDCNRSGPIVEDWSEVGAKLQAIAAWHGEVLIRAAYDFDNGHGEVLVAPI